MPAEHRTRRNLVVAGTVSRGARLMARRLSWGLGDQAVSSLTNFAVGVVAARSLGAAEFGMFSLAWVTYGFVLNISRGLGTDPLTVRFSGVPEDRWRASVRRTSGTALLIGVVCGLIGVLVGALLGGRFGGAFVALGLVLPGLLLQDNWRFAFFAAGQGHKAFVNDVVWAVALVPALLLAGRSGTVFDFVIAWGGAAAVAAAFGCVQTRLLPRFSEVRTWLREQRDLGPRYLAENICVSGSGQIRMYGLGAIAGLVAVGTVRGAELLMGPFLAVLMGLSLVAVPEAARVLRRAPHRLPLFCMLLGGVQAAAALAWGLALLFLLPEQIGHDLLGSVWATASLLILPATLSVMNAGISAGASTGLRALGVARRSLRAQLIASIAYVVGGVGGAAVGGALGSSWGTAIATAFGAVVWWTQLRIGLRERAGRPTEDITGDDRPGTPGGTNDTDSTIRIDHEGTRTP